MKRLLVCLLLVGVVGCGENEQNSESSPQKPAAPTLADSFQGKRIHFEIQDEPEDVWLQLGDNNQVAVGNRGKNRSMSYAINETKLIVDSGRHLIEMRFSKPDLAAGDQFIQIVHAHPAGLHPANRWDGNLQALLDSTDDSGDKTTGSITKIEAAREIDEISEPQSAATEPLFPITGKISYDGKPLTGARIRLEATGRGASRVYACDSRADGTFEIEAVYSMYVMMGAPVGEYKVLVAKFRRDEPEEFDPADDEVLESEQGEALTEAGPESLISEKFNSPSTTPLKLEVKAGKNSFRIDLKSNGTGTVKPR